MPGPHASGLKRERDRERDHDPGIEEPLQLVPLLGRSTPVPEEYRGDAEKADHEERREQRAFFPRRGGSAGIWKEPHRVPQRRVDVSHRPLGERPHDEQRADDRPGEPRHRSPPPRREVPVGEEEEQERGDQAGRGQPGPLPEPRHPLRSWQAPRIRENGVLRVLRAGESQPDQEGHCEVQPADGVLWEAGGDERSEARQDDERGQEVVVAILPGGGAQLLKHRAAEHHHQKQAEQAPSQSGSQSPAHRTGIRPVTVVPRPGFDSTFSEPPSASTRSDMFWSPEPAGVVAGSKPRPSSVTEKSRCPSSRSSRTVAEEASAYLAAFWRASSTQKYAVASASAEYRPTPLGSTVTGNGTFRAWDSRAAASPLSASSGGEGAPGPARGVARGASDSCL